VTAVERLAHFVTARSWDDLSGDARAALKIRVRSLRAEIWGSHATWGRMLSSTPSTS
jgi:hypothetical protein